MIPVINFFSSFAMKKAKTKMYSPVNVSKYLPTNIGLPINDMIKTAAITVIYMIIDMTAGKISS